MTLLPGWHPMVVHFPLALVVVAALLLLAARLLRARAPLPQRSPRWARGICASAPLPPCSRWAPAWLRRIDLQAGPEAHQAISLHMKWAMFTTLALVLLAVWRGAGSRSRIAAVVDFHRAADGGDGRAHHDRLSRRPERVPIRSRSARHSMQTLILCYAVACIFGAAVVRGFGGFGFAMFAIVPLSLVLPPTEIVPSIFIMDIVAGANLLPGVWRDIHWRALLWLTVGCLVGTPFGVYALAHVPAAPMTLALAVFVLLASILLARGYALKSMPGTEVTFTTGVASGLCSGSFGMSGPARDPVLLQFARGRGHRACLHDRLLLDHRRRPDSCGRAGADCSPRRRCGALRYFCRLSRPGSGWAIAASKRQTRRVFAAGSCAC